jgi:hypothetical protein
MPSDQRVDSRTVRCPQNRSSPSNAPVCSASGMPARPSAPESTAPRPAMDQSGRLRPPHCVGKLSHRRRVRLHASPGGWRSARPGVLRPMHAVVLHVEWQASAPRSAGRVQARFVTPRAGKIGPAPIAARVGCARPRRRSSAPISACSKIEVVLDVPGRTSPASTSKTAFRLFAAVGGCCR